jgi:hypothetical protein
MGDHRSQLPKAGTAPRPVPAAQRAAQPAAARPQQRMGLQGAQAVQVRLAASRGNAASARVDNVTTSKSNSATVQPEKNYGEHYGEYLRSGAAYGDGPGTVASGYDDWALGKGYISKEDWKARAAARGVPAAPVAAAVAALTAVYGIAEVPAATIGLIARFKKLSRFRKPLSKEAEKSIRSLEKKIAEHEKKLEDFKKSPTVRPGMDHMPKDVIEKAQQRRIRHLEAEIQTFKDNIEKILNGN